MSAWGEGEGRVYLPRGCLPGGGCDCQKECWDTHTHTPVDRILDTHL